MFQSTPSVSRGRCAGPWGAWIYQSCFNPRPPFPEGDAPSPAPIQSRAVVSIHALRFQRAMLGNVASSSRSDTVSIHALRFQRAMQHECRRRIDTCRFQSTPSVSRGRCIEQGGVLRDKPGFNPRPPFPEGDAEIRVPLLHPSQVSIHALRFQRAMRDTA